MSTELTNLLTRSHAKAFKRDYLLRVAAFALFMFIVLIVIHGLLLVPSYMYAHTETVRQTKQLAGLDASLQTSEEKEVRARLSSLTDNVTYLNRLATTTAASDVVRRLLEVPRGGIQLSGFTYAPAGAKDSARMTLSGVAASRDTLRAYALALGQLPFVTNADLPISAYAKEVEIPFTITLTGTLKP
ncbi:MAG: hypothetical protein AB203_04055 [Parcubacteria bacterium C7867-008]|nr:MAG: hypothetical protein AB203_04055 [Parcubacteria bacterium C7867-008]